MIKLELSKSDVQTLLEVICLEFLGSSEGSPYEKTVIRIMEKIKKQVKVQKEKI